MIVLGHPFLQLRARREAGYFLRGGPNSVQADEDVDRRKLLEKLRKYTSDCALDHPHKARLTLVFSSIHAFFTLKDCNSMTSWDSSACSSPSTACCGLSPSAAASPGGGGSCSGRAAGSPDGEGISGCDI